MRPTIEDVLFLHTVAVGGFGGFEGVRDLESLRAAVARPWGSSLERVHFSTPTQKAAAIAESIVRRQPFLDGNKRTAMYAAAYLLEKLGYRLEADQQEFEDCAVDIAEGKLESEDVARWFEKRVRRVQSC